MAGILPSTMAVQPLNTIAAPGAVERRRALANQLLAQGLDYSPVGSWTQGAARMAESLVGALASRRADREEQAGKAAGVKGTQTLLDAILNKGPMPSQPGIGSDTAAAANGPAPVSNPGGNRQALLDAFTAAQGNEWVDPGIKNFALQQLIPKPEEAYTLGPGQARYQGSQLVAQMSAPPRDPLKVGQGDTLLNPDTYQPIYQSPKDQYRSLNTPEERAQFGIPPEDKRPFQVDPKGQLSVVGGAGVNVTTTVGGEKMPEALLKDAIDASSKADSLENQVQELGVFRDLALSAPTSAATAVTLPIQQAFQSIGIQIGDKVPLMEALQSQQNQVALRLRNPDSGFGLTGNTSNQDIRFLKQAVGGLSNTPAGNYATITIMMAKQRRDALLERARSEFVFNNGTLAGWGEERKKLINQTPFFAPEEQQFLTDLAAGKIAPMDPFPQQQEAPGQQGMPSGTPQSGAELPPPPVGTIETDDQGRRYRFKGGGDRYDQNNWEPVQ